MSQFELESAREIELASERASEKVRRKSVPLLVFGLKSVVLELDAYYSGDKLGQSR